MQGHFALHDQTLTFATLVFVMAHFLLSTIIGIGVTLWGDWFGVLGAGRWRNRTFDPQPSGAQSRARRWEKLSSFK
ncbi:hypothetical protein H0I68_20545 [Yersinia kristensenii]|uniref:hypothetical protein n=1 Tax=Yersinia kristensenii TaxID=28152 RepID=UPI001C6110EF|nr:hypothetical protein [Yersinia kristensenii]MBW5827425.1 hypothetical protein [Yersinia kristensenii]